MEHRRIERWSMRVGAEINVEGGLVEMNACLSPLGILGGLMLTLVIVDMVGTLRRHLESRRKRKEGTTLGRKMRDGVDVRKPDRKRGFGLTGPDTHVNPSQLC